MRCEYIGQVISQENNRNQGNAFFLCAYQQNVNLVFILNCAKKKSGVMTGNQVELKYFEKSI